MTALKLVSRHGPASHTCVYGLFALSTTARKHFSSVSRTTSLGVQDILVPEDLHTQWSPMFTALSQNAFLERKTKCHVDIYLNALLFDYENGYLIGMRESI